MSDIPADYADRLNIREQIARIDRSIDEAAKFRAEQNKLSAEARKFRWDPIIVISGAIVAGAFLRLPEILHAFGVAP
jgi:type II secretory pathway component PulF